MGVVHGLAGVVLPVFGFIYRYFWAGPAAKRREWAEQRQREQAAEREAEAQAESARAEQSMREERERQRQQELANRPPPPTREERLAEAKHRYEATVRMLENAQMDAVELQAARDKAKQRYLRDIDEVLK
jgi:uncharacterized iron-regulated membrane protein